MLQDEQPKWASHTSFIFAASAAAIGLGNIWRFPYIIGQNGGGAFVLTYLLCVILLGIPLILAEIILGRLGKRNPAGTLADLARQSGHTRFWGGVGFLAVLSGFLIMTYYTVVAGWVVDYTWRSFLGQFSHVTEASSLAAFTQLQSNFWHMLFFDSLVVLGSMAINILGIKNGLERAVMIMFPALFALMLLLLIFSMIHGEFKESLVFLFRPDFSKLTSHTILLALGQAFFSLNIGMGVTLMFSAYLPKKIPSTTAAIGIAFADTGFALLAGLMIFPVVFAYHLKAGAGPSLIFQTLPIAFGQMPFGSLFATLFFCMLFFAAFSSVVSILEPPICWTMETFSLSRKKAVLIVGTLCWLLSIFTILSFSNHWRYFHWIDNFTASITLPIGGILTAIFCGWLLKRALIQDNVGLVTTSFWYRVWIWILRVVAPVAVSLILLASFNMI